MAGDIGAYGGVNDTRFLQECTQVMQPHAVCIATGSGQVGQACADARCAAGLGCLSIDGSPRCYRLCTAGSVQECDGEACTGVIVNEGILGYCVPPNVESP